MALYCTTHVDPNTFLGLIRVYTMHMIHVSCVYQRLYNAHLYIYCTFSCAYLAQGAHGMLVSSLHFMQFLSPAPLALIPSSILGICLLIGQPCTYCRLSLLMGAIKTVIWPLFIYILLLAFANWLKNKRSRKCFLTHCWDPTK